MNIREQSVAFLEGLKSRHRNPIKPATLRAYNSYLTTWIVPSIGNLDLAVFKNGEMKRFVAKLTEAELAPATVTGVVNCLKSVVSSAVDDDGNELYPRQWNNTFIDLPVVDPRKQKAPTIGVPELLQAISGPDKGFGSLLALLAASGLRISEAMALRMGSDDGIGSFWLPEHQKLVIRGQMQGGQFLAPKTEAGFREVDVCPELSRYLQPTSGKYLFEIPLSSAYAKAEQAGIPGFHSLRRFRTTYLRQIGTPDNLVKFWIGHGGRDITDRYTHLHRNIALRKEWAIKAGLGFTSC